MKDARSFVFLHDGFFDHPKIIKVGREAGWLYLAIVCYCSRQLTDGHIPEAALGRLTDQRDVEALASRLVEANLLHRFDHTCEKCPAASPDSYVVHDYAQHQRSSAERAELREKRAAAGQAGGRKSGEVRRLQANTEAFASGLLEAKPNQRREEKRREEQDAAARAPAPAHAPAPARVSPASSGLVQQIFDRFKREHSHHVNKSKTSGTLVAIVEQVDAGMPPDNIWAALLWTVKHPDQYGANQIALGNALRALDIERAGRNARINSPQSKMYGR